MIKLKEHKVKKENKKMDMDQHVYDLCEYTKKEHLAKIAQIDDMLAKETNDGARQTLEKEKQSHITSLDEITSQDPRDYASACMEKDRTFARESIESIKLELQKPGLEKSEIDNLLIQLEDFQKRANASDAELAHYLANNAKNSYKSFVTDFNAHRIADKLDPENADQYFNSIHSFLLTRKDSLADMSEERFGEVLATIGENSDLWRKFFNVDFANAPGFFGKLKINAAEKGFEKMGMSSPTEIFPEDTAKEDEVIFSDVSQMDTE